jgi:Cu/Ag efflux protein CusF
MKRITAKFFLAVALVLSGTSASVLADDSVNQGEVRKVDKSAGKITIKHGELKTLDMPAMTMVFQVADKAMLEQVKAGDKVNFSADKVGGQFTLTKIEKQ